MGQLYLTYYHGIPYHPCCRVQRRDSHVLWCEVYMYPSPVRSEKQIITIAAIHRHFIASRPAAERSRVGLSSFSSRDNVPISNYLTPLVAVRGNDIIENAMWN